MDSVLIDDGDLCFAYVEFCNRNDPEFVLGASDIDLTHVRGKETRVKPSGIRGIVCANAHEMRHVKQHSQSMFSYIRMWWRNTRVRR